MLVAKGSYDRLATLSGSRTRAFLAVLLWVKTSEKLGFGAMRCSSLLEDQDVPCARWQPSPIVPLSMPNGKPVSGAGLTRWCHEARADHAVFTKNMPINSRLIWWRKAAKKNRKDCRSKIKIKIPKSDWSTAGQNQQINGCTLQSLAVRRYSHPARPQTGCDSCYQLWIWRTLARFAVTSKNQSWIWRVAAELIGGASFAQNIWVVCAELWTRSPLPTCYLGAACLTTVGQLWTGGISCADDCFAAYPTVGRYASLG